MDGKISKITDGTYPLEVGGRWRILRRMRNVYRSYQLCKYVYENSKPHMCEDTNALLDNGCDALGINSVPNLLTVLQLKAQRKSKFAGIKTTSYNYFAFEDYAVSMGYIERHECKNDPEILLKLTDKGLKLTDNVFLPYTPVGLWKEIWKEHKVFFTLLPSLVMILTGSGLVQVVRLVAGIFS